MKYETFNQVEISFYGPRNRNKVIDYDKINDTMPPIGEDHYACYFRYEKDLKDYVDTHKTVNGHQLPHYCDYIVFDIDEKKDLNVARESTLSLLNKLQNAGITEEMIAIFFSGSKGFHVQVPSSLFDIKPSVDLHKKVKMLCLHLAGEVNIDTAIYDKNRLFRLANTINSKSCLFKVQISYKLLNGKIDEIMTYAKDKQSVNIPLNNQDPIENLVKMWNDVVNETNRNLPVALKDTSSNLANTAYPSGKNKVTKHCISRLLTEGIMEGQRHNAALRLVSHFINEGYPDDMILSVMEGWAVKCSPPAEENFLGIIRNCRLREYFFGCNDDLLKKYCSNNCNSWGKIAFNPDNLKNIKITDTGLARITAEVFKDNIRYYKEPGIWLLWDEGKWVFSDKMGGIYPIIDEMLKQISMAAVRNEDSDTKIKIQKDLLKYEAFNKRSAIINAMTVLPDLIVTSELLDGNPMLLNCINGTINLGTGTLQPHSPSDMITRQVNVEYDPIADCPTFKKFLLRIFGENLELISYVQRFFGYCLTGKTDEQIMLFCYGTGANGKTTLLKLFLNLLSDFAASAQADLLMAKDFRGGASSEIARLKGTRLVAVNEVPEDARLAEAQVKTLTGGDTVAARYLYHEFFEFVPQFKLVLIGNHKPEIKGQDYGIWRRIHLLPFLATIPENERDPALADKLKKELPGILTWAVSGCLEWQKSGLRPPKEITEAVDEYKKSEDFFGQWFQDCCEPKKNASAKSDNVYDSFMEHSGMGHITKHKLTKWLSEKGYKQIRKNTGQFWTGFEVQLTMPLCNEMGYPN